MLSVGLMDAPTLEMRLLTDPTLAIPLLTAPTSMMRLLAVPELTTQWLAGGSYVADACPEVGRVKGARKGDV